jgi:hypothetical protein
MCPYDVNHKLPLMPLHGRYKVGGLEKMDIKHGALWSTQQKLFIIKKVPSVPLILWEPV